MKKINKIFLGSGIMLLSITTPFLLSSCAYNSTSSGVYESFNKSIVTSNDFIKGFDGSSYASTIEEFLWSKKIVNKNNGKVKAYRYYDVEKEVITIDGKEISLMDYINQNFFSYINENSEKVYANYFQIMKEIAGFNSIRLRVWVNPYNENQKTYGGGATDLDSIIWTINQAKKYGFENFCIDFHYSDFWADPERQFIPKEWANFTTEEMYDTIQKYTFESLKKIYESTSVVPSSIQIGNEITNGMIWTTNNKQKFSSGRGNYKQSAKYVIAGTKGVHQFREYCKTNGISKRTEIILHVDNLTSSRAKKAVDNYFDNSDIMKYVDILGFTWYPMWSGNFDYFFNDLTNFYKKFNKKIIISEFSSAWTSADLNRSFSLANDNAKHFIPYSVDGQALMINTFMESLSRAIPNTGTGFYYWEPSWLQIGRSTWASHEGISYACNNDDKWMKKMKEGHNWWDQTIFDQNGLLLSSAKVIKNFSRISNQNNSRKLDFYKALEKDIVKPMQSNMSNVADSKIGENAFLNWNKENYKIKLSSEFYALNGEFQKLDEKPFIDIFDVNIKSYTKDEIINLVVQKIKEKYPRIMYQQIEFINYNFDSSNSTAKITLKPIKNNHIYLDDVVNVLVNFKNYSSNVIDLTSTNIEIEKNDTNWSNLLLKHLNEQNNNIDFSTKFYNAFGITGGVSSDNNNYKIWAYDQNYSLDRNLDWLILKDPNVYYDKQKYIVNFDKVNNKKIDWPKTLSSLITTNNKTLYFAIKLQINEYYKSGNYTQESTLSTIGTEDWYSYPMLTFKFNINLK